MTAQPAPVPQWRNVDNSGAALVNGFLYSYQAGTTTPQATYTDSTQGVSNTNPVQLNSRGEASVWLDPTLVYKLVLTDLNGNVLWTQDQVPGGFLAIPFISATLSAITNQPLLFSLKQSSAEIAASVTPTNYAYAPGDVRRYGAKGDGVTDDSGAFINATASNDLVTLQPNTTYYIAATVTLSQSCTIQGAGHDTVLLAKTVAGTGGSTYSQNVFTSTASVDHLTFRDITLDGGCNNASNVADTSEIAIVKITNTTRVTFERVKLTRYCAAWSGVVKAVSASFWQAITIQNAAHCVFRDCLFTNNHYEMVLIWNAPASGNQVLVDGCYEINSGTPNSHTMMDINGGHVTVCNSFFQNTGSTSNIAIQVAQSVRVRDNVFMGMQPGAAAQINIGQDTFPYNSDVVVEGNYCLNANSAAIAVGMGSSILIRGNIIDTPTNYGIKLTSGVTSFTTFATEYPEWPAPSASGSNSIVIRDNIINAVSNAGSISSAIYLHTINSNSGYWYKDVQISGNTVTAGNAPNNTFYAIRANDCLDMTIRDNWLQYTQVGCFFETLLQNVRIEGNTFSNVPPFASNDILWNGGFTSSNVKIRYNQFDNYPIGVNAPINVFSGTVTGLDVIDNVGIHPTLPVQGPANTGYVAYQTKQIRVTAAPAAGDFSLNDVVKNVPTSGSPGEYLCTTPGSFGSALTCTATGTSGNAFFTCSAIAQLHVGQRFTVAGAGPAAANLQCTCVYITGSTFYVDQVISTTVSGAAMTLISPVFVKSANYT